MISLVHDGIETTILLIDDKPEQLNALVVGLESQGYHVVLARSGAKGLTQAAEHPPSLILLDVGMPRMDGFETYRRLKQMPEVADAPVIFMAPHVEDYERLICSAEGGVDLICKPFHVDDVLRRIQLHLSLQAMENRLAAQTDQLQGEILLRLQKEKRLNEAQAQLFAYLGINHAPAPSPEFSKGTTTDLTDKTLPLQETTVRWLFESNIIGMMFWEMNGNITKANEYLLRMVGYTSQDVAKGKLQWNAITPQEYLEADIAAARELKLTGKCAPYEKEYIRKDGSRCPIMVAGAYINNTMNCGIGFVLDLSERKKTEKALRLKEARLRRLFESNLIGIVFSDEESGEVDANDAFLKIIGYTRDDLQAGRIHWEDLTPPEYQGLSQRNIEEFWRKGSTTYEKEYVRKDGQRVPVLIGITPFGDSPQHGVAFVLDLTERKHAEECIRYMADHDALTGLPNRTLFRDRLMHAMNHAHRNQEKVAVLFIDLDYFKHINDSLGHQIGDCLLKMVAKRLGECVREDDTVARLGGDEFVLSLSLKSGSDDAALIANKVIHALDQSFQCEGHELHIGCSIGISVYPDDGTDVEALMRTADTAMYHAKEKGRGNFQFFTPALNRAAQRRLSLTNALRRALNRKEFELYYQPQVNLENGEIVSAEALLRWRKPSMARVSCNEFIALAEESGLIMSMGEWVLEEACRQLRQWHQLGHAHMTMAVNLSPRQFHQPNLYERIREIIAEQGLMPEALGLEITESVLMQSNTDNVVTLNHLSEAGIKLSVDDFGTGYSSLAYLQRFPINTLKIDRSFISGIGHNRNDTSLVSAIISMAHSLHLSVLAEGVETLDQCSFLLAQGCKLAQGFYYSTPVAADIFTEMLGRQRNGTSSR